MKTTRAVSFILEILPEIKRYHSRKSEHYSILTEIVGREISEFFSQGATCEGLLGSLGEIQMPYFEMGEINSTHLFGLDELILFSFYKKNMNRYKKVADLGANIGLHSIILSNSGFEVTSFEPDPIHFDQLIKNIEINCRENKPQCVQKAVSTNTNSIEFVRVLGNTTGSHIAGAKENPYGELERFKVECENFKTILEANDLIKIDIEGHEASVICETSADEWMNTDAVVEIGTENNAKLIYNHFKNSNINLFVQSKNWEKAETIDEMPNSYKEGSLFISSKNSMPW